MRERGGSVVDCRTLEREVGGSRPTAAVLCPWARHFTPRKYWLITQVAVAPSRHDWKLLTGTLSLNTNKQNTCMHACTPPRTYAHTYARTHTHIYIDTYGKTNGRTDGQTDRHVDKHIHRSYFLVLTSYFLVLTSYFLVLTSYFLVLIS